MTKEVKHWAWMSLRLLYYYATNKLSYHYFYFTIPVGTPIQKDSKAPLNEDTSRKDDPLNKETSLIIQDTFGNSIYTL